MATLNFPAAIIGDFISYPGQAILVGMLFFVRRQLSLPAVFACMAGTSLAAFGIQLLQKRPSFSARGIVGDARNFWRLGRWGVGSALLTTTSTQAYLGVMGWRFGLPAVAALQSLINVVAVTNPVMIGISNAVVPRVASANRTVGHRQAAKIGVKMGMQGALLLGPYLLLVIAFPSFALKAFYGAHSPYLPLTGPLALCCLAYLFNYSAIVVGSILNALNHPRLSFNGQSVSSVFSMVVGLPLAAAWGVAGAALGVWISTVSRFLFQLLALRKVLRMSES